MLQAWKNALPRQQSAPPRPVVHGHPRSLTLCCTCGIIGGLLDFLSHWVVGTWRCLVMGTTATLSVTSITFWPVSSRRMKYEFLPAVCTALPLLLAVLFLTSCRSALFTRCGSVLLASCLLDHPTLCLLTSRKYLSALLQTCLTFSSVCLSACHALRDILMDASDVLRMVCWFDLYHASDPYRILVHAAVLLW